jgi:hypothetical protein
MEASNPMWEDRPGDLVRSIIERQQLLTGILCWFDPDLPLNPCCVQFVFDSSSIVIAARGEDDTVEISGNLGLVAELTCDPDYLHALRADLQGTRMTWARVMTNQLGYTDGVQLDFQSRDNGVALGLVMIAAGSSLQVRSLDSSGDSIHN